MFRTVRDLALGLRPSMLDDFGLQPALEWHVRDFTARYGVNVAARYRAAASTRSRIAHRTCVYRAVQEALTNCVRHAQRDVDHVSVTPAGRRSARRDGDRRRHRSDPARRRNGLGLRGIEERVKELHGTMTIGARPARGTSADDHLPLPQAPNARGCHLRVLLADDHSIVRRGLRSLLEDAGVDGRWRGCRRPRGDTPVRRASARMC